MVNKQFLYLSTAIASLGLVVAAAAPAHAQQQADDDAVIEEIIVTGTYLRRSQADTPSPLQVIGQDDLLDIGANDIADLTQTLTINNGAQNNPDAFTQNRTTGTSNINLRGLGVSSTLVLLNGKRQVVSAANTDGGNLFVDTASLVPLIAVDRVEIIEDGAASLYGSDAVAGVANFITRDEFEGFEIQGDYQLVTDEGSSRDFRVSAIYGWGNDRTHWTVSASYLDRTMLDTRERDLRPERFRGPNGLSVNSQAAQPGNFVVAGFPTVDPTTNGALLTAFDQTLPFFLFPDASLFNPALGQALPDGTFLSPFPALLGGAGPAFGTFLGFGGLTPGLPLQDLNGAIPGFDNIVDFFTNQPSALIALSEGALAGTPFAGTFTNPAFAGQFAALAGNINGFIQNFQQNNPGTALFGAPIIPDPQCAAVAAISDDVFVDQPLAGGTGIVDLGTCQSDFGTHFSHVPDEERFNLYSSFRHEFSSRHRFYADFSYANNEATRNTTQFPITSPLPIAASNPFNPFGVPLLFIGRSPGLNQLDPDNFFVDNPNPNFFTYDTWRVAAGFEGDLSDSWYYDVSVVRGSNEWHLLSLDGLASNTLLALNGLGGFGCDPATGIPGVGPCQFYNPFASGVLAPDGATAPLTLPDGSVVQVPIKNTAEILDFITEPLSIDGDSRLWTTDAVVAGDLFDMPEGPVGLAIGAQWRKERLAHDNSEELEAEDFLFVVGQPDFDADRDVYAIFTEVSIPLFPNFELQGALRFEDYGGRVGDTLDPKVAALYRPADWVAVRASWGTSFRAPSLFQQFGNATSLNSVVDPRDGSSSFFAIRTQGNVNLQPEESENFNAGLTLEPIPDLQLNVDYWRFEFTDVIVEQSPDDLARQALDPSDPNFDPSLVGTVVFLDPNTGSLTQINTEFINAAFINTDGFDFGAQYTWDTSAGIFRLGGEATLVNEYEVPGDQVPGVNAAKIDVVDNRNRLNFADPVPKWRFNLNAAWAYGGHQALVFVRYIDGFTNDEACALDGGDFTNPIQGACPNGTTFQQIDSHTTVDVQYSYTIEGIGPADTVTITAGATNLFDKDPPFVFTDGAFETRTHDPRGRLAYLRLKAGF